MSQVAKFSQSVQSLLDLLTTLSDMANRPRPPEDAVLVGARWAIVRALAEIATFHEKFLLAPLEASGDPRSVAQGKAISNAMQELMQQLIEHSSRWSALAVARDWQGFCLALPNAHRLIRDHFAWEERIVPPILRALEGASATPKRNWARPIWAVQESFSGN